MLIKILNYIFKIFNLIVASSDLRQEEKKLLHFSSRFIDKYTPIIVNENEMHSDNYFSNLITLRLTKYIFINHVDKISTYQADFIRKFNKNFMVYILTIDLQESNRGDVTNDNVEKPSTSEKTSELLPADGSFINKEKKQSKSKIPISTQSRTINAASKDKMVNKHNSLFNLSQQQQQCESSKPSSKGYDFLKRVMKWPKYKVSNTSMDEIFVQELPYDESAKGNQLGKPDMPTSFIKTINPYLDYTLAEALKEVLSLVQNLQESEMRIKEMIMKYIEDESLEKQLIKTMESHERLLFESERRALHLSSETWLQQSEIYKEQNNAMQNTLQSVVHQNRELQEDNEELTRRNEKLYMKIVLLQEAGSPINHRPSTITSMRIIEDLNKNNDKLRSKLNVMFGQMHDLEDTLKQLQRKNEFLQKQINNNNFQLQTNRSEFELNNIDYSY
ncbi:PREDICTED: uncharacterized protein LOC108557967 [Nicrophorus vespilloides]|uniref:Uncharacterized protein LOC108557967 n=1 Tax=Nicrophorus vespilloides TaxID=110193 RepID=A0ABM1M6K5_NICVS|nr:PREDICTED: uncharacterized protein LOC108557967 [Nicrophorus vespilloides]